MTPTAVTPSSSNLTPRPCYTPTDSEFWHDLPLESKPDIFPKKSGKFWQSAIIDIQTACTALLGCCK